MSVYKWQNQSKTNKPPPESSREPAPRCQDEVVEACMLPWEPRPTAHATAFAPKEWPSLEEMRARLIHVILHLGEGARSRYIRITEQCLAIALP